MVPFHQGLGRRSALTVLGEETAIGRAEGPCRRVAQDRAAVMDHAGGWPVGIRAAALSIDPHDVEAGINRFCGPIEPAQTT